jgi:hypothetical protein
MSQSDAAIDITAPTQVHARMANPHASRDNGGVARLAMAGAAATPQVRDR